MFRCYRTAYEVIGVPASLVWSDSLGLVNRFGLSHVDGIHLLRSWEEAAQVIRSSFSRCLEYFPSAKSRLVFKRYGMLEGLSHALACDEDIQEICEYMWQTLSIWIVVQRCGSGSEVKDESRTGNMTGNMTGCTSSIGECCHQEKCATMCKTKKRTPGQGIITVQSGALQSGAPVKPSTRDEEGVTGDKKGPFEIVFSVSQQPGQSVKTVRIKQVSLSERLWLILEPRVLVACLVGAECPGCVFFPDSFHLQQLLTELQLPVSGNTTSSNMISPNTISPNTISPNTISFSKGHAGCRVFIDGMDRIWEEWNNAPIIQYADAEERAGLMNTGTMKVGTMKAFAELIHPRALCVSTLATGPGLTVFASVGMLVALVPFHTLLQGGLSVAFKRFPYLVALCTDEEMASVPKYDELRPHLFSKLWLVRWVDYQFFGQLDRWAYPVSSAASSSLDDTMRPVWNFDDMDLILATWSVLISNCPGLTFPRFLKLAQLIPQPWNRSSISLEDIQPLLAIDRTCARMVKAIMLQTAAVNSRSTSSRPVSSRPVSSRPVSSRPASSRPASSRTGTMTRPPLQPSDRWPTLTSTPSSLPGVTAINHTLLAAGEIQTPAPVAQLRNISTQASSPGQVPLESPTPRPELKPDVPSRNLFWTTSEDENRAVVANHGVERPNISPERRKCLGTSTRIGPGHVPASVFERAQIPLDVIWGTHRSRGEETTDCKRSRLASPDTGAGLPR